MSQNESQQQPESVVTPAGAKYRYIPAHSAVPPVPHNVVGVRALPSSTDALPSERLLVLTQFAAGAVAGLVNVIVLSPLEVVKVRLQAQSRAVSASAATMPPRYKGLIHALKLMFREEGWRSYYKGINASLWAFIPNWAVYWFVYEGLKRRMTPNQSKKPSAIVHVTSALGAGALTALATAPLWTLKSRLQTDIATGARRRYTSVWSGIRKIAAEEGFLALYKGITPTLIGLGHVMVQFPVYEHIKGQLSDHQDENLRPAHILAASSLSKIVASAAFYGHEVVRVRMQLDMRVQPDVSEPVRMARLARDIVRTEGVRGLYRGFGTNLLRTVPACMLTFTSYEMAKKFVTNRAADALDQSESDPPRKSRRVSSYGGAFEHRDSKEQRQNVAQNRMTEESLQSQRRPR